MLYLYGGNREPRAGLHKGMSKQLPGGPGAGWASSLILLLGADADWELGLDQHPPVQGGQSWRHTVKFEWFLSTMFYLLSDFAWVQERQ